MFGELLFGSSRPAPVEEESVSSAMVLSSVLPEADLTCLLVQHADEFDSYSRIAHAVGLELPGVRILTSRLPELARHRGLLASGLCLPVGSSGFMDACCAHAGLQHRTWSCYPKGLRDEMLHRPRKVTASFALSRGTPLFVKPVVRGSFGGFVLQGRAAGVAQAGREQLEKLLDLPPATHVWVSDALDIASVWRYYVRAGDLVGFSPLVPPGTDWQAPPELELVGALLLRLPKRFSCALDLAVLQDGRTTLLCVRDPIRLKLLPFGTHRPSVRDFLGLLWARWNGLLPCAPESAGAAAMP